MNKKVQFIDLGPIDYKQCWDYQQNLFEKIIDQKIKNKKEHSNLETQNFLIFCEHNHVYTIGKSGNQNNLLVNNKYLKSRGASFYKINRGGDITYHGPGQIVGYPILDLENFFTDISKYLRLLEEAVILTLNDYGLKGERSSGETGVWFDVGTSEARKICALGVRTSRWVSMHGFAFNINSDLSYFDHIVPCGIIDKKVTSLEYELNKKLDIDKVKIKLKKNISTLFDMQFY
tara:strand:+ start:1066 stop:1761 length:696 start_codon:yes stop_codon:yes gene_type:complete